MKISLIPLALIVLSVSAWAGPQARNSASAEKVSGLVGQYLVQKHLAGKVQLGALTFLSHGEGCEPGSGNSQSCVDQACGYLPSYQCDDMSEIQELLRACQGNLNGACVKALADGLPSYQRDDRSEIIQLINACRGNYGDSCIKAMTSRLPSYQTDDLSERVQIADSCRHSDGSCIDFVCKKLPSYECDDLSELVAIAKQCSGS